ncbi:MAG: ferritin [bacterium]|nr:ferritin [bacterium]
MMVSKIESAFNEQLNAELFSSYLYLSMAAYFESQNLKGMAQWMRMQVQEENMHAMKFFGFINERGGRVTLGKIKEPKTEWSSPLEVFEDTCQHEAKVTSLVNDLVDLAIKEKDHAANGFLQWFVTEQVEEEATVQEIRDKLKLVSDNPVAMFMIDQELGQRPVPPAPTAQA